MRWKLADKWRIHGGQRLHRIICIAAERNNDSDGHYTENWIKNIIFAERRFQLHLDLRQMRWGLIQEPVTMKKNISIFRCFLLDTE